MLVLALALVGEHLCWPWCSLVLALVWVIVLRGACTRYPVSMNLSLRYFGQNSWSGLLPGTSYVSKLELHGDFTHGAPNGDHGTPVGQFERSMTRADGILF